MSLLGGIGASLRGAMGGVFPSGTLHVSTETIGDYGETSRTLADHSCQAFVADWDSKTVTKRGYPSNWAKVLIVQASALPKPKLNDEVTATRPLNGTTERYRIMDVNGDPADATWQVAGVLI